MINLHDIRYTRVGVKDMVAAEHFATKLLGLEVGRREPGEVYFRSDSREHTMCYFEGDPTDHTTAFDVLDPDDMDAAAAELSNSGYEVSHGSSEDCARRHVKSMITFKDPTGNKIELIHRPEASEWPWLPGRAGGITGFDHVGLCSDDVVRDHDFWTKICSARVSDWIGDSPLLRIDEVHHKLALFATDHAGIQHINHQVESIDDIMRAYYFLKENQVRIVFGPGRHPTSGAVFLYFEGPDGLVYEYSTGVCKIKDEEAHVPRQFPAQASGFCMWGSKPDIAEFPSN